MGRKHWLALYYQVNEMLKLKSQGDLVIGKRGRCDIVKEVLKSDINFDTSGDGLYIGKILHIQPPLVYKCEFWIWR